MARVQDKVALITGGAGGLGGATARRMAEEGAHVVLADLADEAGQALAKELGGDFHHLDVTSEAPLTRMSIRPCAWATASATRAHCASLVTSR